MDNYMEYKQSFTLSCTYSVHFKLYEIFISKRLERLTNNSTKSEWNVSQKQLSDILGKFSLFEFFI